MLYEGGLGLDSVAIMVTTVTDPASLADYDVLLPMRLADSTGFATYTVSLDSYRGRDIRLAVRHRADARVGLLLDEVSVHAYAQQGIADADSEFRIQNSKLEVYPNPATATVTVTAAGIAGQALLQVVDMSGRTVAAFNISHPSSVIDVSQLPAGTYFVRVVSGAGILVSKFLKAH